MENEVIELLFTNQQIKKIKQAKNLLQRLEIVLHRLSMGLSVDYCPTLAYIANFYCRAQVLEAGSVLEAMPLREWAYSIPEGSNIDEFDKEWLIGVGKIVNAILEFVGLNTYVVKSNRCESASFSLMVEVNE